MILVNSIHIWARAELLVELVLAAGAIVGAIRQSPRDRVLLFEFLALASFFLGAFALRLTGFSLIGAAVWLLVFSTFTFLAAYFGFANWLQRRRKAS
jgi:hypothetical protein